MPIYVEYNSADVWTRPEYFLLDEDLKSYVVAGVPRSLETSARDSNPVADASVEVAQGIADDIASDKLVKGELERRSIPLARGVVPAGHGAYRPAVLP